MLDRIFIVCTDGDPYPKSIIEFALLDHVAGVLKESIESGASMYAVMKFCLKARSCNHRMRLAS